MAQMQYSNHDESDKKCYITKLNLCLHSMKTLLAIGVVFGIIFIILGVVSYFAIENPALSFAVSIFVWGGFAIFFFLFLAVAGVLLVFRGISYIKAQEFFFGFSFNDEMKTHNISKTNHISSDWFINTDLTRVVAFRRDFVISLENYNDKLKSTSIVVLCADGKKRKIISSYDCIYDFEIWLDENSSETEKKRNRLVKRRKTT